MEPDSPLKSTNSYYLSRSPKHHDTAATMRIQGNTVPSTTKIKVLGVHIDSKLKWQEYVKQVLKKPGTQTNAGLNTNHDVNLRANPPTSETCMSDSDQPHTNLRE
ncbi:hypothetical protein SBOR_2663 [Sclerotinia borealis F-4128]|uniref:Uncharacterized protein n=1 Tax=Sclerotinia borealis (strain F-4128) TaxID=1432307 RepID=W9CMC2_SCLBF|nr:hypothetical protein SBOR_2663 [Sclerotinia borealis F-4128]